MSELEFIEKISNMSEKQLKCFEYRIYNDCVYYNDCSLCPHKFEIYKRCRCKLGTIIMFKREKIMIEKSKEQTNEKES